MLNHYSTLERLASIPILPRRELISVPTSQGDCEAQMNQCMYITEYCPWHTASTQGMADAILSPSSLILVIAAVEVVVVIVVNYGKIIQGL